MGTRIADAVDGVAGLKYAYGCPSSEVTVEHAACGFPHPDEIDAAIEDRS